MSDSEAEAAIEKEAEVEADVAATETDAAPATTALPESCDNLADEDLANLVTAEEYLMRKDVQLLEYEKQMFLDLVHADGLLVSAK